MIQERICKGFSVKGLFVNICNIWGKFLEK